MSKKTVGIFVGSLRRDSFCRKIANFLISVASSEVEFKIIELGNLPVYNQDYDDDGTPPEAYKVFRAEVKPLDGFLFITPEYNRSVPAVLKNALDTGSRPYGQSVWNAKPGGVISVSPGNIGAFGANHHLRQSLVFLNVLTLQQPEVYLGNVAEILDEKGNVTSEKTADFLKHYLAAFVKWVNLISGAC